MGNIVCEIKAIVEGKRNERLNKRLKSQGEEHTKKIKFLSSMRICAQDRRIKVRYVNVKLLRLISFIMCSSIEYHLHQTVIAQMSSREKYHTSQIFF